MRRCPYCREWLVLGKPAWCLSTRHISDRLIDILWFATIVLIGPALYTIYQLFT